MWRRGGHVVFDDTCFGPAFGGYSWAGFAGADPAARVRGLGLSCYTRRLLFGPHPYRARWESFAGGTVSLRGRAGSTAGGDCGGSAGSDGRGGRWSRAAGAAPPETGALFHPFDRAWFRIGNTRSAAAGGWAEPATRAGNGDYNRAWRVCAGEVGRTDRRCGGGDSFGLRGADAHRQRVGCHLGMQPLRARLKVERNCGVAEAIP